MRAGWKVFWLSAATFGVALAMERLLVPGIVPIAFAEEPQPQWAVQLAFFLRTVELMTAAVAIIALVLMLGAWTSGRLRRAP